MRMLEYGKNINNDSDFNLLIYQELICSHVLMYTCVHFAIDKYRFFLNVFFYSGPTPFEGRMLLTKCQLFSMGQVHLYGWWSCCPDLFTQLTLNTHNC